MIQTNFLGSDMKIISIGMTGTVPEKQDAVISWLSGKMY
jgi:hypothetical protein